MILPEASLKDTCNKAEQIRDLISQLHLQYRGRPLGQVTTSIGIAMFPEHGLMAKSLLRVADSALYRAKAEGRDRVVVGKPIPVN